MDPHTQLRPGCLTRRPLCGQPQGPQRHPALAALAGDVVVVLISCHPDPEQPARRQSPCSDTSTAAGAGRGREPANPVPAASLAWGGRGCPTGTARHEMLLREAFRGRKGHRRPHLQSRVCSCCGTTAQVRDKTPLFAPSLLHRLIQDQRSAISISGHSPFGGRGMESPQRVNRQNPRQEARVLPLPVAGSKLGTTLMQPQQQHQRQTEPRYRYRRAEEISVLLRFYLRPCGDRGSPHSGWTLIMVVAFPERGKGRRPPLGQVQKRMGLGLGLEIRDGISSGAAARRWTVMVQCPLCVRKQLPALFRKSYFLLCRGSAVPIRLGEDLLLQLESWASEAGHYRQKPHVQHTS